MLSRVSKPNNMWPTYKIAKKVVFTATVFYVHKSHFRANQCLMVTLSTNMHNVFFDGICRSQCLF